MAETYTLKVAGLTRELTICKVNDHMDIAAFIMLGDTDHFGWQMPGEKGAE